MSPRTPTNDSPATPPSLFDAELLAGYMAVLRQLSQGSDAAHAIGALVVLLEQRLAIVGQRAESDASLESVLALFKRVTFELLQHLVRHAELGGARAAVARLLSRVSLFEPLAHERFLITQDWFSGNVPIWQKLFSERAGAPGLRCLEIGSFEGMSACWLLENVLTHATSRIVCIDPFDAPGQPQAERYFDHNVRVTGQAHKLTKLKGYSKQALPLLSGSNFDIAYIDGSHHPIHTLEDALAVWPLMANGSLIIFDDYAIGASYPAELAREIDPKPGIDAFLGFVQGEYREISRGYQLVLQKTLTSRLS
ncbi:MAG: class I SAM-dependent methyltransferase [Myxococcota bacterium]